MSSDKREPIKRPTASFDLAALPDVRLQKPAPTVAKRVEKPATGAVKSPKSPAPANTALSAKAAGDIAKALQDLEKVKKREANLKAHAAQLQARIDAIQIGDDSVALQARLEQAEKNLEVLWAAKKSAELAVLDARAVTKETEDRVERVRQTASYQLGLTLLEGFSGWRSMLRLPRALIDLRRRLRASEAEANAAVLPGYGINEFAAPAEFATALANDKGLVAARDWVLAQRLRAPVLSRVLVELAKVARSRDVDMAVQLAQDALDAHPSETRIKHLGFMLMDVGHASRALDVVNAAVAAGATLNAAEERKLRELQALQRLAKVGIRAPATAASSREGQDKRVLAIYAAQTFPLHWSSASMRAHGTGLAALKAGAVAHVISPPNYPPPRADGKEHRPAAPIDGVGYHRLPAIEGSAETTSYDLFAQQVAPAIAGVLRQIGATDLIVASELSLAYPALIAGRLAGVRVIVDCSNVEDHAGTEMRTLLSQLELQVVQQADFVIVHDEAHAGRLAEQGVSAERLASVAEFVPVFESTDATDWRDHPRLKGRCVIGYVGEQSEDVDLEALGTFLSDVLTAGADAALFVVGVGSRFNRLQQAIDALGLGDRLVIAGRPKPGALQGIYDGIDVFLTLAAGNQPVARWRRYEHHAALAYGCPVLAQSDSDGANARPGFETYADREALAARIVALSKSPEALAALRASVDRSRTVERGGDIQRLLARP